MTPSRASSRCGGSWLKSSIQESEEGVTGQPQQCWSRSARIIEETLSKKPKLNQNLNISIMPTHIPEIRFTDLHISV